MVPAQLPRSGFFRFFVALLGAVLLSADRVAAYPPAPYYTLYGVVRDQVGVTLNADGADLILLKDGVEVARTPDYGNAAGQIDAFGLITPSAIPEPATWAGIAGVVALGAAVSRRKRTKAIG